MLSILVTVLFSITYCSANSLLTGFAGFDGSTTDENLVYLFPSGEILLIGRIEVGEINSTFNAEKEINLTRHNCSLTKVFQLENGFVAECQQNSLGGRPLLVIVYSNSRATWLIDKVVIPVDDGGVRMNEGASWVYAQSNVYQWYIYARGGQLCSMEFAEGVPTCNNVDPKRCERILRISSDRISSINFTLACDSPTGQFSHFVVAYSTSNAELTPFRLKYPSHEHRHLFVTKKHTVFVGVDSVSIHDNLVQNTFIYCPVPGDGEIVSALVKDSSLLYTVASKDSQSMTTVYSTYFLDLSTQQCDERKVGEDGCIVYVLTSAYQWWLACPGEIRGYRHNLTEITRLPWPEGMSYDKHVTYTYPPVITLPTHPPTTSPYTATRETPTIRTTNSTSVVEGFQCAHSIIIIFIVIMFVLVIVIISLVCTLVYMCTRQRRSRCHLYTISGQGTPFATGENSLEMINPIIVSDTQRNPLPTGHVTNEPVEDNMPSPSNVPSPRLSCASTQESPHFTPTGPDQNRPTGASQATYGRTSPPVTPDSVPRNSQSNPSGSPVHDSKSNPLPGLSRHTESPVDDPPDQEPHQFHPPEAPDCITQHNRPPEVPELLHETGPLSLTQDPEPHQSTRPESLGADPTVTPEPGSLQSTPKFPVFDRTVTPDPESPQSTTPGTPDFTSQQSRPLETPEPLHETEPFSAIQNPEPCQSTVPESSSQPSYFSPMTINNGISAPYSNGFQSHVSSLVSQTDQVPPTLSFQIQCPSTVIFNMGPQTDHLNPGPGESSSDPLRFPTPGGDVSDGKYLPMSGGCHSDTEGRTVSAIAEVGTPNPRNTADTLEPRTSLRALNKPDGNSKPSPG